MGTPNRTLILQNLVTTLNAINGTGSFKTDVYRIENTGRAPDNISATARPHISILAQDFTYEYAPSPQIRVKLQILLACYVAGSTGAARATNAQNLEDDIFEALRLNPNLTANGVKACSQIVPVRGREDSASLSETGYLELQLEATYFRYFGAS